MTKHIRTSVFETNSSSTHSLTVCTKEEYKQFEDGELLINWDGDFVLATKKNKDNEDYKNYEQYFNGDSLETFSKEYKTKSGDEIIVFGKYGYDN